MALPRRSLWRITSWDSFLPKRFFAKTAKSKDAPKGPPPPPAKKAPLMKTFKIYRYNPENKTKKPFMQSYTIDISDCRPMILDALQKIKMEQDPTLAYRRSCREGICGSCGMNVDGINRLACLYKIRPKGTTKIYPLPHMYVIKDLVVDFTTFLNQHARIKPYLIRKDEKELGQQQYLQSVKDKDLLDGYIECVLCACCSTSCPEYWWHGHSAAPNDFMGPAAILNAYRWLRDSRDEGTDERLSALKNYFNIFRCHQINNCTSVCPKRLEPGRAMAEMRLLVTAFKKKKAAEMKGMKPSDPLKACLLKQSSCK